jgi:hypothetical protein
MVRLVVIKDCKFTEALLMVQALIQSSRVLIGAQSKSTCLTGSTERLGTHRLLTLGTYETGTSFVRSTFI